MLFTRILTALLTHLTERTARVTDLTTSICAVLTAEACNTGPEPFIRYDNPALRRDRLAWVKHRKSSWPTCIFRVNERFLYEYDFCDLWQHQVRIEKRLEAETHPWTGSWRSTARSTSIARASTGERRRS